MQCRTVTTSGEDAVLLLAKLHVLDGQYGEARLNEVSSAVMVLMVSFSCRISLLTLTVIFFESAAGNSRSKPRRYCEPALSRP